MLSALGTPPTTLLVVPDYHRSGSVESDLAFRPGDRRPHRTRRRRSRCTATTTSTTARRRIPRSEWLQRRVLTASEGEFSALTECEAELRIDAGLRMFERLKWNVAGFVAPAWLLGAGARAALAQHAHPLHEHARASRNDHRRPPHRRAGDFRIGAQLHGGVGPADNGFARQRAMTRDTPLLRVALHPADADDADLLGAWRDLLGSTARRSRRADQIRRADEGVG